MPFWCETTATTLSVCQTYLYSAREGAQKEHHEWEIVAIVWMRFAHHVHVVLVSFVKREKKGKGV
jgi:hypothetical protein